MEQRTQYSRDILAALDININSASNCIFLPSSKKQDYIITESIHNGGHLGSYYTYVNNEIKDTLNACNPTYEDLEDDKIVETLKTLPEDEKNYVRKSICDTLFDIKSELLEGELIIHDSHK